MKNITKTMLVTTVILTMGLTAHAKGRGMGRGHGPRHGEGRFMKIAATLDLSETQQAEIKQLRFDLQKDIEPLRKKMEKQRNKTQTLWMEKKLNEQALMDSIDKKMRIKTKMRKRHAEFRIDVLELLTPTQQVKFRNHMKERRERREERKKFRGERRGKGPGSKREF